MRIIEVASTDFHHRIPLARFTIGPDGVVHATYHSPHFREDVEDGLVYTGKTGPLRPSDGLAFMNALSICFSQSSHMDVTDTARGAESPR